MKDEVSVLYKSPVGILKITSRNEKIILIEPVEDENFVKGEAIDETNKDYKLCLKAVEQLNEYFQGKRKVFDLPLNAEGTEFQMKVWKALCDIPYGETRSYSDIAKAIGNTKAVRAVGGANNKNPIAIVVPCHRVIGKNGSMVGYGGGLPMKEYLLQLEKAL
ncbi:methylated-DNA--[protein]-cysteine S-methyltransferase [Inconstantimicrobium porci]|uniref:Methylated-DNA--protein-cysteine methyltransferase n=2 Tax=Inconstantimicrobium porci TaxID=2652291 RepID=A0A7X2T222_9CLOT|nr:methylated-DNA--[protein]-cysteine S-methyltransferase [Inconstantimicrobium porci]MSR92219.1 methylated-DNA--[protein]-cysteine S-methyltransferase [Inconstantimicrobium porci]